ncbi:UvrB/UvrC motif-containing protein [Lachnoanaerobaculum sp. OBRC5-5]|uniref:UvrB/UvrC motif-containing protein n=1 Tax=Lachnoanaerobaculum sp. OBRC5-5 TaxID=936595 RepID=UPI0002824A57|nr:UvrB/UvrC motif-containing protein [Lachnoanaerobaculum sp. OBRC5-5]EJZ70918.1 hypothetical protein HMPREF1135_00687 [Lachnoanaerobaculum sp. OBRC5-5]
MLCEKCKIREANVFYTEIIDGDQKNEHHLCSKCAGEIDQYSSLFDKDFSFSKLLSGILGDVFEKEENNEYRQIVCPTCNTRYDDFIKNSMFGCKDCFEVFNLLINDNIKQIHGNDTHVGKVPKNYHKNDKILPKSIVTDSIDNIFNNEDKKIENLKHKLEDAIKKEDFAQAAILRDKIKTIKEDKEDVV